MLRLGHPLKKKGGHGRNTKTNRAHPPRHAILVLNKVPLTSLQASKDFIISFFFIKLFLSPLLYLYLKLSSSILIIIAI
jgi:hypothetical protein